MTREKFEIIYWIANVLILCVTAYFIYRSIHTPIQAVRIGRQLDNEKQKDNAKRSLFLLLFSLRGNPLHHDFVRGLNQIEVVFEDVPQVISAWRTHFASLGQKDQVNAAKNWEIERAALLSSMAVHLGYSNIPHGELLRDYYPVGHDTQLQDDQQLRADLQIYLKTGIEMQILIIEQMKATQQQNQIEEQK